MYIIYHIYYEECVYIYIIRRSPTDFAAFQNNAPRSSWWLSDPANCPSCVAVRTMINGCHFQLQRFIHLGLMSHRKDPGWHAILTWSLLLWRLLKIHFSNLIDSWHDRGSKNWVTNSQEIWDMCLRSASIFEAERITAFGMTPMTPKFRRGDAFSQHDPTLPESLAASEANQPHAPSGDSISGEPRPIDPWMAASMAADCLQASNSGIEKMWSQDESNPNESNFNGVLMPM